MKGPPTTVDAEPNTATGASIERRLRILRYQLDFIRAEMLHLLHERDKMIYSASWLIFRPLRALEENIVESFLALRRGRSRAQETKNQEPTPATVRVAPGGERAKAPAKRLLVDVTGTVRRDMATGIERVVKNVVKALYQKDDPVIPTIAIRCEGGRLLTCHDFVAALTGKASAAPDAEIVAQPGDRFLMLSDSWNAFDEFTPLFERIRASGGEIVTCVFDLIPELYPYGCHEVTPPLYRVWLRKALLESDSFIAISRTVAEELKSYVKEVGLAHRGELKIGWFHCGSDIPVPARPSLREPLRTAMAGASPIFLCVGTIEPRKGHRTALEAFDELWRKGVDARLVIVGRNGWYAEALIADIKRHPEFGRRLFWFNDVDDGELSALYDAASAVLCPSYAEGFGLPIVEAARRGRPAICSDIAVFREVGGAGAAYFPVTDAHALANCVEGWLAGEIVTDSSKVNCSTWADAADRIVDVILRERWIETMSESPVAVSCDQIRLLECELEWLYAEMLLLAHEREKMIYSASWGIFSPLRKIEAQLVRAVTSLWRERPKANVAGSSAKTFPQWSPPPVSTSPTVKRLLIDVTGLVKQDVGTGIQRVVKNLLRALHQRSDQTIPAIAVHCESGRLFAHEDVAAPASGVRACSQEDFMPGQGDVFLMLSDTWNTFGDYESLFGRLHAEEVQIVTGVHDLIPELYPHACHEVTVSRYDAWFRSMLMHGDGVLAVSRTVAEELEAFVIERGLPHRPGLKIGWFHNGSDIVAKSDGDVREKIRVAIEGDAPVFLCVGTLEPRKGYRIVLRALDRLWSDGVEARLIIVGRRGWYDEALVRDILAHSEFGRRLHWFDDTSDPELSFLYDHCAAVLCASFAEGFGLPIVEAARRGRPVICSDIAVFREVGGDGAAYFRANDPEALTGCLRGFLAGDIKTDPRKVLQTTWADAAHRIVTILVQEQWSGRLS